MWTVYPEPVDSRDALALLRDYFAELTVRYFQRETTEQEIDETLAEFPSTGVALFLILRTGEAPAGCLALHATGELTRMYVAPLFRRAGGARALLTAAESWARRQGLTRLFLDTRSDLVEARSFYASCGFIEIPRATRTPGPFQDHWSRSTSRSLRNAKAIPRPGRARAERGADRRQLSVSDSLASATLRGTVPYGSIR